MNKKRLEFATIVFLNEMRRQFVLLRPDQPSPLKALSDYPPAERSALMSAIEKTIESTEASTDDLFRRWQEAAPQSS
jgi:diadenosine tetraphosphate (Ap4A) HIT family hydrolase